MTNFRSFLALLLATTSNARHTQVSLEKPFQKSFSSLKHSPCITVFTRNGGIGCGTADHDEQRGFLVHFADEDALANPPNHEYVALIPQDQLSKEFIKGLLEANDKGFLQGILVLNTTSSSDSSSHYSAAPAAPQGKRTASQLLNWGNSYYSWNSIGDGLMQKNLYGIPMVFVHETEVSSYLLDTIGSSDNGVSDIVAQFNYYMGPKDIDSFKCLAWRDAGDGEWRPKCDPLGGNSIWATAGSLGSSQQQRRKLGDANAAKEVLVVGTAIDALSLFYSSAPGANTAASNTLALLMAAKLIGDSVNADTLAGLSKEIVFGFFQAEAFGFLGSRSFLQDVAGFQCTDGLEVPSVSKNENSTMACLYPMRPSLEFEKLGQVTGMLTIDQVGVLTKANNLYVHQDESNFGQFLSAVLQASAPNGYTISEDQPAADDDHFDNGEITIPPTPLTSLLSITEGAYGGAVLAGYGATFNPNSYFWSHRDTAFEQTLDLDGVAMAATVLARGALAAAYDDGSLDSDTSSQYAANLIAQLDSEDETLVKLADCLYYNQRCQLFKDYAKIEGNNEEERTGISLGSPWMRNTEVPDYRASVVDWYLGQPLVQVGNKWYGSYIPEEVNEYGKDKSDAFSLLPSAIEASIRGLLNDFLGRPTDVELKSCKSSSACNDVDYCAKGETAVCTGGKVCVCPRAHYHQALDENLVAAPNNATGHFLTKDNDEELSAMYTEAKWSSLVGVKVYRSGGNKGGWVLAFGIITGLLSLLSTVLLRRGLKKEKLY